jgi:A/G-specific adenine glycosylase
VLLEQRPNHGIWGGLLSLPQIPVADDDFHNVARDKNVAAELQQEMMRVLSPFGEFDHVENLPPLAHGFTHFKLHIAPYRIHLTQRLQRRQLAGQLTHVWYAISDLADAPLPAPVKKLLLDLR